MPPPTPRHGEIRNLLAERGRLSVEELAGLLRVTTMTIRRDLSVLEKAGILTRTHGGCVLRSPFVKEAPFSTKDRQRREKKYLVAREAAGRLEQGNNVYLDTGTTAVHLARLLPTDLDLRVFTNNLRVAMELFGRQGVEVVVFGGVLAENSPDLTGELALARVQEFRVDVAVLGADAVDSHRGEFYSADLGTALLSRAVQKQADKTIVVADSSKFGKQSLVVAGRFAPEMTLITDSELAEPDRTALEATGAEIVYATPETHERTPSVS
ncbi:MAG: DeoR/GlpR transcriptional regulator [Pirellulales bacterium]|nr:DeoR/GlpR transcriptional regulator [Pirellulales bacterium]